jgi:hypothetical protein
MVIICACVIDGHADGLFVGGVHLEELWNFIQNKKSKTHNLGGASELSNMQVSTALRADEYVGSRTQLGRNVCVHESATGCSCV